MSGLKLKAYLKLRDISASDLSKEIGQSRQNISNWIKEGATVIVTDIGIKIRSGRIVHETQVKK